MLQTYFTINALHPLLYIASIVAKILSVIVIKLVLIKKNSSYLLIEPMKLTPLNLILLQE